MNLQVTYVKEDFRIEYEGREFLIKSNSNGSCLYEVTAQGCRDISYTPLFQTPDLLVWAGMEISKLPVITWEEVSPHSNIYHIWVNDKDVAGLIGEDLVKEFLPRVELWCRGLEAPEFMSEDLQDYAALVKQRVQEAV